ncbi:hypothetical protein ACE6H2_005816 [Prunus campanulata]
MFAAVSRMPCCKPRNAYKNFNQSHEEGREGGDTVENIIPKEILDLWMNLKARASFCWKDKQDTIWRVPMMRAMYLAPKLTANLSWLVGIILERQVGIGF